MTAFHPLRSLERRATKRRMLSDAKPIRWMVVGLTALGACATATPPQPEKAEVWVLGGNHEALAAVKQAAENCRYADVNEMVGGHVEPYLHIAMPTARRREVERHIKLLLDIAYSVKLIAIANQLQRLKLLRWSIVHRARLTNRISAFHPLRTLTQQRERAFRTAYA